MYLLLLLYNIYYYKNLGNICNIPGNYPGHFSFLLYNKSENILYFKYDYIELHHDVTIHYYITII